MHECKVDVDLAHNKSEWHVKIRTAALRDKGSDDDDDDYKG